MWQVAELNVPYVLMHMRGDPTTMQSLTDYTDTCLQVGQELQAQAEAAMAAGIEPWRIILDPGAATAPVCLPPTLCLHAQHSCLRWQACCVMCLTGSAPVLSVQPSSVFGGGLSFGTTAAAWVPCQAGCTILPWCRWQREFQQHDDHTTSKSQIGYI